MSSPADIRILTTPQELSEAAAEEVLRAAKEAIEQRGRFTIALSGGSTPKNLFNLLATNARNVMPWDRTFFFWGDERHVPPTDPDSNYRMAEETMLSKIPGGCRECVPHRRGESRCCSRGRGLRANSAEVLPA